MKIKSAVRADLRRILLTVPGLPAVFWETRLYKPTPGAAYIRESLDSINTTTQTLGRVGKVREQFLYQLKLYWPTTDFVTDGEDMADEIRMTFEHGREIASIGANTMISGHVLNSEVRPTLSTEGFTLFPIIISFYVLRPRSAEAYA